MHVWEGKYSIIWLVVWILFCFDHEFWYLLHCVARLHKVYLNRRNILILYLPFLILVGEIFKLCLWSFGIFLGDKDMNLIYLHSHINNLIVSGTCPHWKKTASQLVKSEFVSLRVPSSYTSWISGFLIEKSLTRELSGPEQSMKIDDRKINWSIVDNRLITVD